MKKDYFFDLKAARETLPWLIARVNELENLGSKGEEAMENFDLDSAESYTLRIQEILAEIQERGIILRDLRQILIDFPAVINNMPAYLCWMPGESEISHWHYADEGFAGRKEITGNENILSYL